MTIEDVATAGRAQDDVLDFVARVAPGISARAPEIEDARRVPTDLIDTLVAGGCFRMLLPRSFGGHGSDVASGMRVYEALSRADASVGWTVALGAGAWCDLAGLPRSTLDALYAGGPDVLIAGVFNPTGSATRTDGGYRVDGRWSFASGCLHSRWLYGNCVEIDGGEPRIRTVLFDPSEVTIEDTWRVCGLRGTGSHHFVARDVTVPAERTCLALAHESDLDEPIVRVPPPALFALSIASVAVGIAQGALDDILGLASGKVPLLAHAPLAANPGFQRDLALAHSDLRAARMLLYGDAQMVWSTAVARGELTLEQRAQVRSAAAWATSRATTVVDMAYTAGGGTALFDDCPLQRRLRDMHALTQHFLVKRDTLTTAGAVLAGQDVDLTVF